MSKLTRGNVLATIKKLKKTPRPKAQVSAPAVQAICGQKTANKSNKVADLKATLERRRLLKGSSSIAPCINMDLLAKSESEYEQFIKNYKSKKASAMYVIKQ